MRISLLALSCILLTSCGPKGYEATQLSSSQQVETGYQTEDGKKFVVGQEPRLEDEKRNIAPLIPIKRNEDEKRQVAFQERLREFQFLRFDNSSSNPSRLGKTHYRFDLKILGENGNLRMLTFTGAFKKGQGSQLILESTTKSDPRYTLTGEIDDLDKTVNGRFTLQFSDKSETRQAVILYRAYEAQLNVRTPKSKNLEEHINLSRKIENLKNNTRAWVNNFSVPYGVSTFDIAVIRRQQSSSQDSSQNSIDSLLEFSGRSVETDTLTDLLEPVQITEESKGPDVESIELIGNGEGEDTKIFSVKMKDDNGETTEILVDIEREKTEEEIIQEQLQAEEMRQRLYDPVFDAQEEQTQKEEKQESEEKSESTVQLPTTDIPIPTPRPDYTPPKTPAKPALSQSTIGNNEKSYLIARSGRNALKIINDFEKNFTLSGVQKEINAIKKSRAQINKLKSFFKYAHPFRDMIEKIAAGYDVPPQYAYVSLIESAYFYGGNYQIQVAKVKNSEGQYISSATGPFQIIYDTARGLGMRVLKNALGALPGPSDERRYFAPSACGAAKYFRNNARIFSKDATLAILAYNQGEGRAAQLAREYGYTYAEIARNNVSGVSYSNKKLAAYFLAGVYKGSSFDVDAQAPKQLPNTTVYPPNPIKDSTCRSIVGR